MQLNIFDMVAYDEKNEFCFVDNKSILRVTVTKHIHVYNYFVYCTLNNLTYIPINNCLGPHLLIIC